MDISAFVPLQGLGLGRRAARLAVQSVFRNEEETRSEFLSLIRQCPNGLGSTKILVLETTLCREHVASSLQRFCDFVEVDRERAVGGIVGRSFRCHAR